MARTIRYIQSMRHRLTSLRLWLLLLTLVGVQTLGLVHGVLHAHHGNASPSAATFLTSEVAASPGHKVQNSHGHEAWLAQLFGDHHGADCRLFDQLAHGDQAPLPLAPVFSAAMPLVIQPLWPATVLIAGEGVPFDARAPPSPDSSARI